MLLECSGAGAAECTPAVEEVPGVSPPQVPSARPVLHLPAHQTHLGPFPPELPFSPKIDVFEPSTGNLIDQYQPGLKLNNFKNTAAEKNQEFLGNKQQDAQEYLLHLLNVLEKQEKKYNLPSSTALLTSHIFERYTCMVCGRSKLS